MIPISESEILDRLGFDNPWWDTSKIENRFDNLPRRAYFTIYQKLVEDTEINRAIVLMGPRRVGKTVMVYHSIASLLAGGIAPGQILYLSLETPIYTGLSLEKIVNTFVRLNHHNTDSQLYIFFDEV